MRLWQLDLRSLVGESANGCHVTRSNGVLMASPHGSYMQQITVN